MAQLNFGGVIENVMTREAVSYTHLDVYKRQGIYQYGLGVRVYDFLSKNNRVAFGGHYEGFIRSGFEQRHAQRHRRRRPELFVHQLCTDRRRCDDPR